MTRGSIREDVEAVRPRYLKASTAERTRILDEFCQTTGYHRKSAVRVLRQMPAKAPKPPGRPRQSGQPIVDARKQLWETSDHLCSTRLAPFLAELLRALERHQAIAVTPEVREQLRQLSPAPIDRRLPPFRRHLPRRPDTQTKASATLKSLGPIRTFSAWEEVTPGALQADLVAHWGESTDGFDRTTLLAVDVATGWTACQAVWGKGQQRVGSAIHLVRQRLPFPVRERHTDTGGEFLTAVLSPYGQRHQIHFTRGRPYKKNDQAYAEQKNWLVVRRLVGDDRDTTKAADEHLQRLDERVRRYRNFFPPLRKLIGKERVGAKVRKRYDRAQTPDQRLVASGVLREAQQKSLGQLSLSLNPLALRAPIDEALEVLWQLAERGRRPDRDTEVPSLSAS